MQIYVASPKDDLSGKYIVEKWDEIKQQYIPLKGEEYPTWEQAEERARELNEALRQDNKDKKEGGENENTK